MIATFKYLKGCQEQIGKNCSELFQKIGKDTVALNDKEVGFEEHREISLC